MVMLHVLISLFMMAALYGMGRTRFQVIIGIAAIILAPAAYGILSGTDGLIFSLVGAGIALFLTLPLSLLGFVGRTDVIISIALGGTLGAVSFAIAFCIALILLSVQRMLRIESALPCAMGDPSLYGAGLLALDEKSALVEIEAMRLLRMDRKVAFGLADVEDFPRAEMEDECARRMNILPWCAKLAIATLVILMAGITL